MPKKILAIANYRVSSDDQLLNNSLARQEQSVQKAALELGAEIVKYWSGSVSSKKGLNIDRKDLYEMLAECRRNPNIKYAIFDELDRFMRSMLEIGYFIIEFKKLDVQIKFASQPSLRTDTAADTLMLMLEAFKAEGSNEERQRKSISGQTMALQEGRYPFSPKPGYKRGRRSGVQEIHPIRGKALQVVLLRLASHIVTPTQALIELNKSEFMKDGHAPYKMDKFRKIATDPFYAGIVEIDKQVKVRNENGLHKSLISKEQHEELVRIISAKKKNQAGPRKNGNPKYPGNNIVHCELCKGKRYSRYVGYDHGNGQNPNLVYEKYRCRSCSRYMTRSEMHEAISKCFNRKPTKEGIDDLIEALDIVWKQREGDALQEANRINHKIKSVETSIASQVEAATDPAHISIQAEILSAIEKKKEEVVSLKGELANLEHRGDSDRDRFLRFAFDFIENTGEHFLDPQLSQANRLACKQIIFPAGFWVDADNNVYTPEISTLYRLATKKKDAEASDNSHLVRARRLKLLASSLARMRSIN